MTLIAKSPELIAAEAALTEARAARRVVTDQIRASCRIMADIGASPAERDAALAALPARRREDARSAGRVIDAETLVRVLLQKHEAEISDAERIGTLAEAEAAALAEREAAAADAAQARRVGAAATQRRVAAGAAFYGAIAARRSAAEAGRRRVAAERRCQAAAKAALAAIERLKEALSTIASAEREIAAARGRAAPRLPDFDLAAIAELAHNIVVENAPAPARRVAA
jgi:hypothetical protein